MSEVIFVIIGILLILFASLALAVCPKSKDKQRTLRIDNKSHVYMIETPEGDKEFIITSKPKEELLNEFKHILEQYDKEN